MAEGAEPHGDPDLSIGAVIHGRSRERVSRQRQWHDRREDAVVAVVPVVVAVVNQAGESLSDPVAALVHIGLIWIAKASSLGQPHDERVAGMREIRVLSQLLTVEKPLVLGLEGGVRVILDGAHELTHCENLLVCPHAKRVRLVHPIDEQRHFRRRFKSR